MSEPFWSALGGGAVDYEGVWDVGKAYVPGDVVRYGGVDYLAVNPSQGVNPGAATGAGGGLPAGGICPYAGATAPVGYLMCDGASVATATYPELFAAIGYAYGGSGANFSLPDLRGRLAVGKGTNAAVDALGENEGVAEANRRPQHRHTPHAHGVTAAANGGSPNAYGGGGFAINNQALSTASVDGGSGVAADPLNSPAYIVLNYLIKT